MVRRPDVPGLGERHPTLRFRFGGSEVLAVPGESIAAALLAAGEAGLRRTRSGSMRGPFCGMGACHDCLVSVDGATLRACLAPVREGMQVAPHAPRNEQRAVSFAAAAAPSLLVDVAVVGAGPAGLAAARAAAGCGVSVALIDERQQAGGQYFKQPAAAFPLQPAALDAQFRAGRALIAGTLAAGVTHLAGTMVFAGDGAQGLLVQGPDGARRIGYRRLVLATGAVERGVPFPGWTLPGVMTTGAAQSFLRAYGVAPGGRVVIAGAGPLNLQLAAELRRAGVTVLALAEASAAPGLRALRPLARMLATAPRLVADGLRYRLALAGVPLRYRTVVVAAEGEGRLARVALAPLGPDGAPDRARLAWLEADALCLGYGFNPALELAASLGCALRYDARFRHLAVQREAAGRTSLPAVFAVGDGAAFGGARVAQAAGTLAGFAAAQDCDAALSPTQGAERHAARVALRRATAFQAALWRLYDAPPLSHELADGETLICRCEEVDRAAIEASGAAGLGALKRATRLGMGRCQGRYCGPVAAELLAAQRGGLPAAEDMFAPRSPLRPVPIGALAALDLGEPLG